MAKRIIYVITKANWGGAQRYVHGLATAAKAAGHTVAVAYGEPGELSERLSKEGISTLPVHGLSRDVDLFREIGALGELVRLLRRERPDVVHINSSKAGGLGAFAARVAGVPLIIFTAHGWAFNEARPAWQRAILFMLSGLTVWLSDETLCVSEAVRRDISPMPFTRRKLRVIHNGVSCEPLLPREEARRALVPEAVSPYWIGMLSELHPTKRIEDALLAFARIAPAHPEALLVVMGAGELRKTLQAKIRALALEGRAFLAGHVKDAPRYLGALDLFVHSSQSEALALAVLEAGCAGLPVIATRVGGIPEIIPDASYGILVPARAPHALASAMESLIADPEKARALGARLKARVTASFSKEAMVRETLARYED